MRLHNRQVKGTFWNDTELLVNLTRDGRMFYQGLWHLAEDSGCVEDDPYGFKIHLFPGDLDIIPSMLAEYRDKLIEMKKLTRYEVNGKVYLYLNKFHKHQKIKNQDSPVIPLPHWIQFKPFTSNERQGRFIVSEPDFVINNQEYIVGISNTPCDLLTNNLQSSYKVLTDNLQSSSNHNLNHNLNLNRDKDEDSSRVRENEILSSSISHEVVSVNQITAEKHYQENIGLLPPVIFQSMQSFRDDGIKEELIIEAINIACAKGVRTWKYIQAILQSCVEKNIYSLEQFKAKELEWKQQQKAVGKGPPGKPDYLNYDQRKYGEDYTEDLFENMGGK